MVASVYLHHSEALSVRNAGILEALAARLVALGRPLIIGGDWNLTPSDFQCGPWLAHLRADVVATGQPTCRVTPADVGRELDFFVVSLSLVGRVRAVQVAATPLIRTHSPVQLDLAMEEEKCWIRVLLNAAEYPRHRPHGPV